MRWLVTFSALVIVGCSAAPQDPHDDAGFSIKPADEDAGADAMTDAKPDVHVADAAPKPTPSCPNVPEDVSNFKPSTSKPPRPFQAACGAGQVTAFYNACSGSAASSYSCQTWSSSAFNSACGTCIASNDSDSEWGPLVNHSDYAFFNEAGCAQLLGASSCASAAWADEACLMDACDGICYGGTIDLLDQCETNAIVAGCKSWDDAETAACVTTQGVFNKCFATDRQTQIVNIIATFCGGS